METKDILDFLHFSNPTEEQKIALTSMQEFVKIENQEDFLILCGAAGTGKTSITSALIGYLNSKEIKYKIAAPTGRAARILGRKAKTLTSTIHSMIYTPVDEKKNGYIVFRLKKMAKTDYTIFIIDEASMISTMADQTDTLFKSEKGLLDDLIMYIKSANANNKIILLGDHYQLPPINEEKSFALQDNYLRTRYKLSGKTHLLTEVKRQEDGSYILQNATEIRNAIDKGFKSYPIQGEKSINIRHARERYVRDLRTKGPEHTTVISVSHKANNLFNTMVRERIFKDAKKVLHPGDLMMVTQNWMREGVHLYNGDHVQILNIDWNLKEQVAGLHFVAVKIKPILGDSDIIIDDYVILDTIMSIDGKIDFQKEKDLRAERYRKNKIFSETGRADADRYVGAIRLIYGYAITCNKAQGGEWNKVYINTLGIPNLKWQYTAVTRAKNEIEKF